MGKKILTKLVKVSQKERNLGKDKGGKKGQSLLTEMVFTDLNTYLSVRKTREIEWSNQ